MKHSFRIMRLRLSIASMKSVYEEECLPLTYSVHRFNFVSKHRVVIENVRLHPFSIKTHTKNKNNYNESDDKKEVKKIGKKTTKTQLWPSELCGERAQHTHTDTLTNAKPANYTHVIK